MTFISIGVPFHHNHDCSWTESKRFMKLFYTLGKGEYLFDKKYVFNWSNIECEFYFLRIRALTILITVTASNYLTLKAFYCRCALVKTKTHGFFSLDCRHTFLLYANCWVKGTSKRIVQINNVLSSSSYSSRRQSSISNLFLTCFDTYYHTL